MRRVCLIALLVLGIISGVMAHPQTKAVATTPRLVFQGFYAKADKALNARDIDTSFEFHSPEFTLTPPGGGDDIDLTAIRYRLTSLTNSAKKVWRSTSVVSASVKGTSSSVMVKSSLNVVLLNPDTKTPSTFVDRMVTKDTWSHGSDGWQLIRSLVISEAMTLNGHKVYDRNNPFSTTPPPTADNDSGVVKVAPDSPDSNAPSGQ